VPTRPPPPPCPPEAGGQGDVIPSIPPPPPQQPGNCRWLCHGGVVVFLALIQTRWGEGGFGHPPAPAAHVLPDTWINPSPAHAPAKQRSQAATTPDPATCLHLQTFYFFFFLVPSALPCICFKKQLGAKKTSESLLGVQIKAWAAARGSLIPADPIVHLGWPKTLGKTKKNIKKKHPKKTKKPTQGFKEHQFVLQSNHSPLQRTRLMSLVKDAPVQPRDESL